MVASTKLLCTEFVPRWVPFTCLTSLCLIKTTRSTQPGTLSTSERLDVKRYAV